MRSRRRSGRSSARTTGARCGSGSPRAGLGNFASAPTAEELTELEDAARALEAAGNDSRAKTLRSLGLKIRASLREADRRRLSVDVEAQLRAEAFACAVGPRPLADPAVLGKLREALLAGLTVKFDYGDPPRWRKVVPYGLLFGPRAYLVARVKNRAQPVLFRLDAIHGLDILDEPGAPPPDFDLKAYAGRSFGVFQEEPQEVELRFAPSAAPDARGFLFHPTQTLDRRAGRLADGALPRRRTSGNGASPDGLGAGRDDPRAEGAAGADAGIGRRPSRPPLPACRVSPSPACGRGSG